MRQQAVWRLLGEAIETIAFRGKWLPFEFLEADEWVQLRPFAPDVLGAIPDTYKMHPWFDAAARLPRGKADHLVSIVALRITGAASSATSPTPTSHSR